MTDKKEQNNGNINIVLMAACFFIPYYGLRIALEKYLGVAKLAIGYSMLLGLISGLVVAMYMALLMKTGLKIKIIGLGILLAIVVAINLLFV